MKDVPIPGHPQDGTRDPVHRAEHGPGAPPRPEPGPYGAPPPPCGAAPPPYGTPPPPYGTPPPPPYGTMPPPGPTPPYGQRPEDRPPGDYPPRPSDEPPTGYPPRTREPRPPSPYGERPEPPSDYVPRPPEEPPIPEPPRPTGPYPRQPEHEHPGGHRHPERGGVPAEHVHPAPEEGGWASGGAGAPRQNQRSLTSQARLELYRRIRDYIVSPDDPVRYHRENGHVHGTLRFLPWHRQFLRRFERWQRTRLADASNFVPLAFWDPSDPMPPEFREPGQNPAMAPMPLPPQLRIGGGLETLDFAAFAQMLEAHHNATHGAIGGAMLDPRVSPHAAIFWLLHAFYDNVYATWEELAGGRA